MKFTAQVLVAFAHRDTVQIRRTDGKQTDITYMTGVLCCASYG